MTASVFYSKRKKRLLVYLVCSRRKLQCISSWAQDGQQENNKLSCACVCVSLWWKFVAHGSHFYLTKDIFKGRKKAYIHTEVSIH